MSILFVDFETRSRCDITKNGGYRYALDPSTEALMLAYAFDDEEIAMWEGGNPFPQAVRQHIDNGGLLVAHNAQFERLIFEHVLEDQCGVKPPKIEQYRCTAAQARASNIPASLDNCSSVVLGARKKAEGGGLIKFFCVPRKDGKFNAPTDDPEGWETFKDYCIQDVALERRLYASMTPLDEATLRDYQICERINDRGLGIDVSLANAASKRARRLQKVIQEDIVKVTQGKLKVARGVTLTRWVYDRLAINLKHIMVPEGKLALGKDIRQDLLSRDLDPQVRRVIELNGEANVGSVAKFTTALGRQYNGRICGSYILDGASTTRRYAAFGFQPQNLPRESADDPIKTREKIISGGGSMTDLKSMIRAMIVARSGHEFVCADLSQIEGRVIPWLSNSAGGSKKLEIFADPARDIYCETASGVLGKVVTPEDADLRTSFGKVPELALGFGGGHEALQRTALKCGVNMPEAQAKDIVKRWRKANSWIEKFWADLEIQAIRAYKNPGEAFRVGRVAYRRSPGTSTLQCALPDGISLLNYHQVRLEGRGLTAMHTRFKPKRNDVEWPRSRLWKGTLVENITQATAGRIQCIIIRRLEEEGYSVVGHAHDEVLVEAPSTGIEESSAAVQDIVTCSPPWATDLPLASEVWVGKRYRK